MDTCAICGTDLSGGSRKCYKCERKVCKSCYSMQTGFFVCHRCTGDKPMKEEYAVPIKTDLGIEEI